MAFAFRLEVHPILLLQLNFVLIEDLLSSPCQLCAIRPGFAHRTISPTEGDAYPN